MRVKKLEILGFKSFANKTTVHFEPGVTAIVGPNGSGKSNIVDAIRWVLGEHNPRDVRAPRLEDVIFNGTDRRAPLSMAEVHLTIANEQGLLPIAFSEVTITRRVFRSGESECFINQSPCRLKDIHELFLGTGLGGGTYAIIEQGHIDMILSSKPEERRVVFEEAGGVAKYLAKKQETVRRLDEVEEHLVRIADIISEVRRQVNALERAANKARQYKSQWEELKQLELRLAVHELCAGAAHAQAVEESLRALRTERDQLEAQKQAHVTSLEVCNSAVSAIQQRLQELRATSVERASQIEQHESQRSLKQRWIEELGAQAQELEREEQESRARLAHIEEQRARTSGAEVALQAQLAALQERIAQGVGELAHLTDALQATLSTINDAKTTLFEAASEAAHQRNQLSELTSRLHALEAQRARIEESRAQRAVRAEEVQRRREAERHELVTLQQQYEDIQRRIAAIQQALDAAGARRHELNGRLHQLRDQLASGRANVALLEDLWRRYEGFPETVKTLMGRSIDGLLGPLVDLVQAAPGYESVVEAALGPLAEALVVRDRGALARCREALGVQELEGCRFLVLSDCPAEAAMEPVALQEGVSAAVRDYVRTESQYQPLVDWILNDSWIIDDIGRWLGGTTPQGRLVSARGDRWDRRSWRFGGSRSATHGRLGRRPRWEQAQQSLHAVEQEFGQLETQAQEAERSWQTLVSEQEAAKGQTAQVTPRLHTLETRVHQVDRDLQRLEEEQCAGAFETEELIRQQDEARASLASAEQAAAEAQRRQEAIQQALNDAQASRETTEQRKQELLIAQAQIEATRQSITERIESIKTRAQEIESDCAHLAQQLQAKALQRQEALRRSGELAEQRAAHEQAGQQLGGERERIDAEVGGVAKTLQEEEAKRDQVLPQLLATEQQLSSVLRKVQEQEQSLSERAFRRSHVVERLRELYQIDETTIQAEQQANPPPLTDEQRTETSERVQRLRSKLEGIGPVSLGSVEEYDELKRRLEFLQTQQQDLVQAREDLKTSIAQINRTARTQFRETFDRITKEFQHYYARLFNGGEANLILMDEQDVLECGIDIVARPPGKRLQTISLLSGGERALTAVALLFALFKVQPSPFCILDEIDAPLDEANVDRFTRVLEEFLALSQFILVTHNKKTITKADSLYGVTMEEPGISKILSAKLKAASPAPAATVA